MNTWQNCKKILCIRPDNMGDLLMTTPAIRALKHTFNAQITVLTSSMAAGIARNIPEIDDIMVFDVPWVKSDQAAPNDTFAAITEDIKNRQFDAAIIFTVYSQNPLPTVMLAYLANIPLRLAYCRENPYQLLTHWQPDKEPYQFIKHQVRRDLDLVATVGAHTHDEHLSLQVPDVWPQLRQKLQQENINPDKPWLIMHPGVSEPKREYPSAQWAEVACTAVEHLGYQVLFTGSGSEREMVAGIQSSVGKQCFNMAGKLSLDEFIYLLAHAPLVVSVNTGTIHIAAATGTPTVVLYALTNPQHTPWMVPSQVLSYNIPAETRSKNEVIAHVNHYFDQQPTDVPCPDDVIAAIKSLLNPEPVAVMLNTPQNASATI
ncbi:glycosyltransferase family 9 protein [Mucilaginibacter sp. CSA2-8R]|uniref:glycosyltransferase family 9 protein n=1 Tax=Mucilaginibacter sp. CSA2-8R TaxID=3141542 RepID=UPI00315D98D5